MQSRWSQARRALRNFRAILGAVPGAILGVAWQTKVDRRKRGTKWGATRGTFSGVDWSSSWIEVYESKKPTMGPPIGTMDYFMDAPNEDMTDLMRGVPFEYAVAVKFFVVICLKAGIPANEIIAGLHHLRALLVTLNAHHGASESELMILGNWRTNAMPSTYTAHAREIPLALNQRLIADTKKGWAPNYEGAKAISVPMQVTEIGEAQKSRRALESPCTTTRSVESTNPSSCATIASSLEEQICCADISPGRSP